MPTLVNNALMTNLVIKINVKQFVRSHLNSFEQKKEI